MCASLIFASSVITAKGVVVDAVTNQPIPGAILLSKANPELACKTTTDGTFNMTVGICLPNSSKAMARGSVDFSGNRLIINGLPENGATISLYNNLGRQVFTETVTGLGGASRSLGLPAVAYGMYLLTVTTGNSSYCFKKMFPMAGQLTIQQGTGLRNAVPALAKTFQATDELVAMAVGYLTGTVALTSIDQPDVQIALTPSHQAPASTTFDHDGSMVKIRAKDCSFSCGQPVPLPNVSASDNWTIEAPVHMVSFTYDFWMDTTEVTQKMFNDVMSAAYTNYQAPSWSANYGLGDNIPAYHVNYNDAILYCNALSKAAGLDTVYSYSTVSGQPGALCSLADRKTDFTKMGFRLPTEAEFKYACRGGSVTDYFWGKNFRPYPATHEDTMQISSYAVWSTNAYYSDDQSTHGLKGGVASKLPNGYGLYDMVGSLSEFQHVTYFTYPTEEQIDPKPTPADTSIFPLGGNWGNGAEFIRSAVRPWATANYEFFFYGFRTVKEEL